MVRVIRIDARCILKKATTAKRENIPRDSIRIRQHTSGMRSIDSMMRRRYVEDAPTSLNKADGRVGPDGHVQATTERSGRIKSSFGTTLRDLVGMPGDM